MKRVKSIDTLRGCCIILMILVHMFSWWVRPEDYWLTSIIHSFLGDIAAGGFLFVSGLSAIISFRNRFIKVKVSEDIIKEQVRNEYLIRALLIFIAAIIYNSATAIGTLDPSNIWKWYVPLTIAASLFLAYPFFRTSKLFRIICALIIWIAHYFILSLLLPYEGQFNIFGILYYILYNNIGLHPILNYFSYFLIGTVIGDVIFEISLRNDQKERLLGLKSKLWLTLLISGLILILFGVLYFFPGFLTHGSFPSMIYSIGVLLTSLSILLIIEEFEVLKVKKNYRFFYFYSFYSLTIYFSHNIIYFIFLDRLNAFTIWIAVIGTYFLLTLLIRIIYKRYGIKASLKAQIGRISLILIKKIESKKKEMVIINE